MAGFDTASRANTVLSLLEKAWDGLRAIGAPQWAASLFAGAVWSWYMRLYEQLPTWVLVLSVVVAITLALSLYASIRTAFLIRGKKSFDLQQFGDDCVKFYQDFAAIMSAQPGRSIADLPQSPTSTDLHEQWRRGVDASQRMDRLMLERFGARAFSLAHQMQLIGVPPPNMFHFSHGDAGGAAVYIGTVGELLKKGLLDEAKKMDPRLTWGASFR